MAGSNSRHLCCKDKLDGRKGDLSRRQLAYELTGLSFREYLSFEGIRDIGRVSLAEMLENHRELAVEVTRGIKILPLFRKYLESGYYPFYKETPSGYVDRVIEGVNKMLDSDLPTIEDVTPTTIRKTKKMLSVLSASCPQLPNMSKLYRERHARVGPHGDPETDGGELPRQPELHRVFGLRHPAPRAVSEH